MVKKLLFDLREYLTAETSFLNSFKKYFSVFPVPKRVKMQKHPPPTHTLCKRDLLSLPPLQPNLPTATRACVRQFACKASFTGKLHERPFLQGLLGNELMMTNSFKCFPCCPARITHYRCIAWDLVPRSHV